MNDGKNKKIKQYFVASDSYFVKTKNCGTFFFFQMQQNWLQRIQSSFNNQSPICLHNFQSPQHFLYLDYNLTFNHLAHQFTTLNYYIVN